MEQRLIDANASLRKVEQIPYISNENKAFHEGCRYMQKKVFRILHESKAIEAEPVIRCKDCKYFGFEILPCEHKHSCNNYQMPYCKPTDYCSYGEMKESG